MIYEVHYQHYGNLGEENVYKQGDLIVSLPAYVSSW